MLGRLEKVDLRSAWPDEARHFTPWLAQEENISLLGEAIGLELEVEEKEKPVGPFSADILCKNISDDSWVLIENQLERTDHIHLGQLLTYGAGLDAVTIIWISPRFTEEHRAALDWLNKITDERFNFFGLEIELWKIGDSQPAPKFNVVSKPNDWTRLVAEEARRVSEISGTRQIQLEYWSKFRSYLELSKSRLRATKPLPQNWMNFALGRTGFKLDAIASTWNSTTQKSDVGEIRAELSMETSDAKQYFAKLLEKRETIEASIGEPLDWYNPDNAKACRVRLKKSADVTNVADWQSQHEWLKLKLEKMQSVFGPVVKEI